MESKVILVVDGFEVLNVLVNFLEFLLSLFRPKTPHVFAEISIVLLGVNEAGVVVEDPGQNRVLIEIVVASAAQEVETHYVLEVRNFIVDPLFGDVCFLD